MIKPLKGYIILQEVKTETTGLTLSDDADVEKPNLATVSLLGEGEFEFKVSDTLLIKRHLFDEVSLDGQDYLIGKNEGVVAIYA